MEGIKRRLIVNIILFVVLTIALYVIYSMEGLFRAN